MLVAVAIYGLAQLLLPPLAAICAAAPFIGVGLYAGLLQLRGAGPVDTETLLGKLRGMSWENFSAVITEAFRRDGYEVKELSNGTSDLELRKNDQLTLVSCKRWKAARTGIEPLRDLLAARRSGDAQTCIYVSAGTFSAQARSFAETHAIHLLEQAELAQLTARVSSGRSRWKLFG